MCPSALQGCKTNQAHTDTHPTKSEWDSSNAKLAKRSYGKGVGDFRGIVRFGKGWCGARGASNPSGSRPNFFGRQHLTFDKGGKDVGVRRGTDVLLRRL